MTKVTHQTTFQVRWSETDPAGIVFYGRFYEWFDRASDELFQAAGLPWKTLFREHEIVGVPILEANCRFRSPVRFGDRVTVISTVVEVNAKTFKITHDVLVGETACASGYEVRAWVKERGDGTLKAVPLPDEVARQLRGEAPATT